MLSSHSREEEEYVRNYEDAYSYRIDIKVLARLLLLDSGKNLVKERVV